MSRCLWIAVALLAGLALPGCCKSGGYRACVAGVADVAEVERERLQPPDAGPLAAASGGVEP